MVETYAANMTMLSDRPAEVKLTLEDCITIDNVCHDRKDHDIDFIFMYVCVSFY